MKSKKLHIYEIKSNGSIMLCPTQGNFKQKNTRTFGSCISGNVTNEKLGKEIRRILVQCD